MSEVTTKPQSEEATTTEQIKNAIAGQWAEKPEGYETKLSTGEVVLVQRGKGKHIQQAYRLIDKPEQYDMALRSILITIDGNYKVYEAFVDWFNELPIADAQRLATKFGMVNFS